MNHFLVIFKITNYKFIMLITFADKSLKLLNFCTIDPLQLMLTALVRAIKPKKKAKLKNVIVKLQQKNFNYRKKK